MTTANPINDLIRTALADLQPRLEIHRANIDALTEQLAAENSAHANLLEQDAAYRAALPADDLDQLIEDGELDE